MAWAAPCFVAAPVNLSSLHRNHPSFPKTLSIQYRSALLSCHAPAQLHSRYILTSHAALVSETAGKDTSPTPADVEQGVSLLKSAAKTRKVAPTDVFYALRVLEKAKLDPSGFLQTIGGTESPGRTWMLVFTAGQQMVSKSLKGEPGGGFYFPVTAVQRFDAAALRIENGIYFGPLGFLTLEGAMSWETRRLAFFFETISIKVGPLGPFQLNIKRKEDEGRIPSIKDPFFTWYYADDEIIVARGKSGGVAFWCRCARVSQ